MTLAAKELHLTQSGISQHVKALESILGKKLFDRIHHKLIPTSTAKTLYEGCARGMVELEHAFWQISGKALAGTVSIGAPPEFAYNVLLPSISEFCKTHDKIVFQLVVGLAPTMSEKLLRGDLDFAFVDDFGLDPRVVTQKVYEEVIELCVSPQLATKAGAFRHHKTYYETLPYLAYELGAPVLNKWFEHHLPKKKMELNIRGYFSDCQSVAKVILSGIGAGVLPSYLVDDLEKRSKKLVRLPGSGKPLSNTISLAHVRERTHSLVAQTAMDFLASELAKKTPSGLSS